MDELNLSPEEMEHFLARVCRRLKIMAKFKELKKESRQRHNQQRREREVARRARSKETAVEEQI